MFHASSLASDGLLAIFDVPGLVEALPPSLYSIFAKCLFSSCAYLSPNFPFLYQSY